jgi:hypothetical protein
VKRRKKKTMKSMCSDNKNSRGSSRKIGSLGNDDVWMRTRDIIIIIEEKKKKNGEGKKKDERSE